MPYIYKYTDKKDNICKYIGIIRKDSNFPNRFKQHKGDNWADDGDWLIEYAYYPSICDVEALEGHLISKYHTDEYYNKKKTEWGECTFIQHDPIWEEYSVPVIDIEMSLHNRICDLRSILIRCESDIQRVSNQFADIVKEADKSYSVSQNDWIRKYLRRTCDNQFVCRFCSKARCDDNFITKSQAFDHYESRMAINDWAEFINEDDFWDELNRRTLIKGAISKDRINGYVLLNIDFEDE